MVELTASLSGCYFPEYRTPYLRSILGVVMIKVPKATAYAMEIT
jgi:hypothetical protein